MLKNPDSPYRMLSPKSSSKSSVDFIDGYERSNSARKYMVKQKRLLSKNSQKQIVKYAVT